MSMFGNIGEMIQQITGNIAAGTGDNVTTQASSGDMVQTQEVAPSFQEIANYSMPSAKTQELSYVRIGDQLQREISPIIPEGVQVVAAPESSKQLPWLIFGLILSYFLTEYIFKKTRGKK